MVVEKLSGVCWLLEGSHHEQNGVPVVTCECVYARQSEFSVNGCSGWFDQHSCTFRAPRCGTDLVAGLHYCLFSLIFEITKGASALLLPQGHNCSRLETEWLLCVHYEAINTKLHGSNTNLSREPYCHRYVF